MTVMSKRDNSLRLIAASLTAMCAVAAPLILPAESVTFKGATIEYTGATATTLSNGDLLLKYTDTAALGTLKLPGYTKAWVLLVGGGGAGGSGADGSRSSSQGAPGGGGGGGFVEDQAFAFTAGDYKIQVGSGGAAASDNTTPKSGGNGGKCGTNSA
jgi:hypothetical protein